MTTKRVPKKPDERRVWIKGQLELAGLSFATIARELGVSRQAVRKPSRRMEKAIAEKIGLPPERIWPERYGA
ncbi:MAG: hypothetical protein FPO08_04555 [Geobacter sp.]|nr:MAG: hypothetical protein FPO08_04555 [Geobacter sp.]